MLQRAELRRHVLTLVFGLASRLAFAAACIGGAGGPANVCVAAAAAAQRQGRQPPDGVPPVPGLASPLLAPLSVLLQWVATHPDCLRCAAFPAGSPRAGPRQCGSVCSCWWAVPLSHCSSLLPILMDVKTCKTVSNSLMQLMLWEARLDEPALSFSYHAQGMPNHAQGMPGAVAKVPAAGACIAAVSAVLRKCAVSL